MDHDLDDYRRLMTIVQRRRSVRRLETRAVLPETLKQVLEAARWAPSASNRQAYRLIVTTSRHRIAEMASAVRARAKTLASEAREDFRDDLQAYVSHFEHFSDAPALIVPIYRRGPDLLRTMKSGDEAMSDPTPRALLESISAVAAATMNLLLAAESLGLGACWMTGPLVADDALSEILAVPSGWAMASVIPLGYPAEQPATPRRRPLERLLRRVD